MQAIHLLGTGGTDQLKLVDIPIPKPGHGEVLIKLKMAALNHLDLWVRRGIPGVPPGFPHIPGCDGAGTVEAIGDGCSIAPGTDVVIDPGYSCRTCAVCLTGSHNYCRYFGIMGEHRDGTYAQYLVMPEVNLLPKPAELSWEVAAAAPLAFLTAWRMLHTRGHIKAGEDVLIMGASGGVSSAGIQIAKLAGARVLAVTSSPEKVEMAHKLGADIVYDRTKDDWAKQAFLDTDKKGVDLVLENVGTAIWPDVMRPVARGGRIVICGSTTGSDLIVGSGKLFMHHISILGSTMGDHDDFKAVMGKVFTGELTPVIDSVFPFEEAGKAQEHLEAGKHFGKVVLEIPD